MVASDGPDLVERAVTAIAVQTSGRIGILVEAGLRGLDAHGAIDPGFGRSVIPNGGMLRVGPAIAPLDTGGLVAVT